MVNVAVLVSGSGSNLQAIIDEKNKGNLPHVNLKLIVASNHDAYALTRGEKEGIATCVVNKKAFSSQEAFEEALLSVLKEEKISLVVLAGYLTILSKKIIKEYENRIINVHPSLIPSFCGKGYYGLKVHEEALAYGVKVTGATVHYVNEIPDGGKIIKQKAVDVLPFDSPEILQKRVMKEAEWIILPKAVEECCKHLWEEKGTSR